MSYDSVVAISSTVVKSNGYCRLGDLGYSWRGEMSNCLVVPYSLLKSKMKTAIEELEMIASVITH